MKQQVDWRWRSADFFPWCEVFLLPISVVIFISAMLSSGFQAIALSTGVQVSGLFYVTIAIVMTISALATCINAYFGLPRFMRGADLLLCVSISILISYLGSESTTPWELENYTMAATGIAWFLGTQAVEILPMLFPPTVPKFLSQVLKKRVWVERLYNQVYGRRDARNAIKLARFEVGKNISIYGIFLFIAILNQPAREALSTD